MLGVLARPLIDVRIEAATPGFALQRHQHVGLFEEKNSRIALQSQRAGDGNTCCAAADYSNARMASDMMLVMQRMGKLQCTDLLRIKGNPRVIAAKDVSSWPS